MNERSLLALSPVDGRYASQTSDLSLYFSEFSIIKARVFIEIQYLLFLAEKNIIPAFTKQEKELFLALFTDFSLKSVKKVKVFEEQMHHDVKAVEYFLKEEMRALNIKNTEFVHIGLTSEDINNCVYSLALQNSVQQIIIPKLKELCEVLTEKATNAKSAIMLAKTHGQPAVPTTMGKELIIFAVRLARAVEALSQVKIDAKVTGAVGNFNAQTLTYPEHNWLDLSTEFISRLGLQPHLYTTQILPPDSYVRIFDALQHINNILLDLDQDMWRYISDGVFIQTVTKGQVGSSTMPQKVNPIDFENSEGNLGVANALLHHFSEKLPISRLQRDLSDSTVKRNIGVALAHSLLAYNSTIKGLKKINLDTKKITDELDNHWEVVTEGIQTVLRTAGDEKAYEKLKELSRGKQLTQKSLRTFIDSLKVDEVFKRKLYNLQPTTYTGLAETLVDKGITEINTILNNLSKQKEDHV